MTTAARATPRLPPVPASQNTAPVAEFRCLYTHDLRRKQKRWQDGFLKFHSFNNRVMVYDTSRSFLGDTYWKGGNELQEGDELTLDKGVMVEVADAVGVTQTDLTPIFEKNTPNRPNTAQPSAGTTAARPATASRPGTQLRHKSLNSLLGTPKGPIGKAVAIRSPYEQRQEKEKENEHRNVDARPPKRQKITDNHLGIRVSAVQEPFQTPANKQPPSITSDARSKRPHPKPIPQDAAIISLESSEPEAIFSDVTLPGTPPRNAVELEHSGPDLEANKTPASAREAQVQMQTLQTPRLPQGKVPVPSVKAKQTPKPPPRPSSPPVSASNRLSNIEFAIQPPKGHQKEPTPQLSPSRNLKTKSLRLSTGVKRGMLMCQSPAPGLQQNKTDVATSWVRAGPSEKVPKGNGDSEHEVPVRKKQKRGDREMSRVTARTNTSTMPHVPDEPSDTVEDMGIIYGMMDQQLMVSQSPPTHVEVEQVTSPPHVTPKQTKARTAVLKQTSSKRQVIEAAPVESSPIDVAASSPPPPDQMSPTPTPPTPPTHSHPRQPTSVATSASTSPQKPPSAGGFRKKPKCKSKAKNTTVPTEQPPTNNAPPPPHPLRAKKNGPLMSEAELSSHLQDQSIDTPNEKGEHASSPKKTNTDRQRKSQNAAKRTRSESDALPVPSKSAEWEARNLRRDGIVDDNNSNNINTSSYSNNQANPAAAQHQNPNQNSVPQPPPPPSRPANNPPKFAKPAAAPKTPSSGGLASLIQRTDPRKKCGRTQSLNATTDTTTGTTIGGKGGGTAAAARNGQKAIDTDIGPWSTEAFDLLGWKPAGR